MRRRRCLQALMAAGVTGLNGCAAPHGSALARARVLVVGGGYAGATAAKYLRLLSDQAVDVTLVEPNPHLVSCPVSNLVIGGLRTLDDITLSYERLSSRHGVRRVQDRVVAIDPQRRTATLAGGERLGYDRLVLAPGVDFLWDRIEGLKAAHDEGRVLHAWKAGPETLALARQIEAMPDGGTCVIAIPEAPYRCPPGPYERACLIAARLRRTHPRAKVLVLDANPDITSKAALFRQAWKDLHPGMIEYRLQHRVTGVDVRTMTLRFEVQEDLRADVINLLPDMRAGDLAVHAGLATANGRWCPVDFRDFRSVHAPGLHVLGDALQIAPGMPKSGHMANAQAKVAAAAIVAELLDLEADARPMLNNVCYSLVDTDQAIHVASVHAWQPEQRSFVPVPGAGGLSAQRSSLEARHAEAWARNIWADMLG